jgi:hypothetical protein
VLKVILGQHNKPKAAVHSAELTGPLKKKKKKMMMMKKKKPMSTARLSPMLRCFPDYAVNNTLKFRS